MSTDMPKHDDDLDPNLSLVDLERNSLEDAERFYRSRGSKLTPEEWQVLYHLQDNPKRFEALSRHWRIVESA